jgi:hypothetical protein
VISPLLVPRGAVLSAVSFGEGGLTTDDLKLGYGIDVMSPALPSSNGGHCGVRRRRSQGIADEHLLASATDASWEPTSGCFRPFPSVPGSTAANPRTML